jgi:hypothetical protein
MQIDSWREESRSVGDVGNRPIVFHAYQRSRVIEWSQQSRVLEWTQQIKVIEWPLPGPDK